MKCLFCGAEVELGKRCEYCGSRAELAYYNFPEPQRKPPERERTEKKLTTERTYTVKTGDTLWAIAKRFYGNGREFIRIKRINGLEKSDLIYPGRC